MNAKHSYSVKKVVILGIGGNCIDILDTLLDINTFHGKVIYDCIGFLDDREDAWGKSIYKFKVLGALEKAKELTDCYFIFGIGSTRNYWKREKIWKGIGIPDKRFETVIHPTATISRMTRIGIGTVILQHVTVNNNVRIGRHVLILPNTVISHDNVISEFSCIAGGASLSGNVRIGRSCYIGAGSSIREGVKVGDNTLIGIGSVVLNDVEDNSVMVGNPARFLRKSMPD